MPIEIERVYQQYAAMSARERHLELRRLVYEGFPTCDLPDLIADQPRSLPFSERFDIAFNLQEQIADRRVQSQSEYKEIVFDRVGILLSFAPVTTRFKMIIRDNLEIASQAGVAKPSDRKRVSFSPLDYLDPTLIGFNANRFARNVRVFVIGELEGINLPGSVVSLILDEDNNNPTSAGIFDKHSAKVLERTAYQNHLKWAARINQCFYTAEGTTKLALYARLKLKELIGKLEEEVAGLDYRLLLRESVLRVWKEDIVQNYGR